MQASYSLPGGRDPTLQHTWELHEAARTTFPRGSAMILVRQLDIKMSLLVLRLLE